MHSMRSAARLFMPMHKVLLYHSHFATLNSDVGVEFLQALTAGRKKNQQQQQQSKTLFILFGILAVCSFVCIHFMLYRFNLSKQLRCDANRRTHSEQAEESE